MLLAEVETLSAGLAAAETGFPTGRAGLPTAAASSSPTSLNFRFLPSPSPFELWRMAGSAQAPVFRLAANVGDTFVWGARMTFGSIEKTSVLVYLLFFLPDFLVLVAFSFCAGTGMYASG